MNAWLAAHPVIWQDAAKFVLAGGVALGWWAAPATPLVDLGSAAAALAFGALTWLTHQSVSPAASQHQAPTP
jgi:hypothetical protein